MLNKQQLVLQCFDPTAPHGTINWTQSVTAGEENNQYLCYSVSLVLKMIDGKQKDTNLLLP